MIEFHHVSKQYDGRFDALIDTSLFIDKGEFVYVTGASGAGKTTFLRMLYSAEKPTKGQILIDGQNITRFHSRQIAFLRRKIGVVFQDFKLLQSRTVYENVAFALEAQGKKRYEVSKKVYQALKPYMPYYLEKRVGGFQIMMKGSNEKEKPPITDVFKRLEQLEKGWGQQHLKIVGDDLIKQGTEIDLSYRFNKKLYLSVNFEATFQEENRYNRIYLNLRRKF